VYIEEVPSGVRTIVGVATSVAAFIDYFARGPMDRAIQIFGFADFEREFGGLDARSEGSYAIQQFFLNGGTEAWVIRTGKDVETAAIVLQDTGHTPSLSLSAGRRLKGLPVADPGSWGNFVRLDVDYDTVDPATLFNLTVSEVAPAGNQAVLRSEIFRNLTMATGVPNSVYEVVNDGSRIVQVAVPGTPPTGRPAQTGTVGAVLNDTSLTGIVTPFDLMAQLPGDLARPLTLGRTPGDGMTSPAPGQVAQDARALLEAALRAANPNDPRYANASVQLIGGRLRILAGRAGDPATPGSSFDPNLTVTFAEASGTTAAALGLIAGASINVQQYALGGTAAGFEAAPVDGDDGDLPDGTAIIGARLAKTGLFALEDVDIFNILCIPRGAELPAAESFNVYSAAEAYCLERRAFLIVDIPSSIDSVQEMKDFLDSNAGLRSRNAAIYFPRLRIADPLNQFRLRDRAASGTMAGLYARTDNDRGVWKAPAGIEATLRNVSELRYVLSDPENGTLNPLGINCLRTFPITGNTAWGARTLEGADVQASEWKYLPVRRFALFLEESLYRGTRFAIFEPNDEPLWAQIRLNIGAFLQTLFRQGAFQGQSPREAYFVKCDKETTTQADINLGIVNILVGFAPLKPAEFVIIRISQIAGQIQT
jgi:phage tail sheath protein FI